MDVLIVDDDPDIRTLLRTLLELRGWQVRVAHTAEDGLLELATARPDLLLLDLSLPQRDGIGLLKLLDRGIGRPANILVVSALPEQAVRAVARRHQLAYLHKPFSLDALDAALDSFTIEHPAGRR